jgi:hypothetical protein
VQVVSESSWTSWFGAAAARKLVVTVHNESSDPVRPLLVARWLQGSDAQVVTSPTPPLLRPGGHVQISAPFDLSTFADGRHLVVGKVTGSGFTVLFASSTSTTPWALYVLGILLAVGLLLLVAVLIGRRFRSAELPAAPPPQEIGDQPTSQLIQTGAMQ